MKQKLLKLMCLLCVSMMGMSAWADTTYTLEITTDDFNTTSYAGNNTEKTTQAVCTTDASVKMEVKWKSYQVMLQSSTMQWQKSAGYIYNITELGTITSVTVTSSAGTFTTYYGNTAQPSSSTTNNGNGFFQVKVGSATGKTTKIEVLFTIKEKTATTTTISSTDLTNTDLNVGTAAGTLTANVTDENSNALDASSVVWSSSDESVVTVGETTGVVTLVEEGTATITATYPSSENYESSIDTYVITVTNSLYTTVWSEDFTGYAKYDVPENGTNASYTVQDGGGTTCAYDENLAGGDASELLVAKRKDADTPGQLCVTIEHLKSCLKTMKLSYKSNKDLSVEILVNGLSVKTSTDKVFTFELPENPMSLVIKFSNTLTSNARIDDIVLKGIVDEVTYERNVTVDNYGTICLPSAASVVGATVYSVAGVTKSDGKITGVTLEEVTGDLVAGTPYIFKATADKLVATYKDFAVDTPVAATGLVGNLSTAATINAGEYIYILGTDNKMHKLSGTATATVATNRAYLNLEGVAEAPASVKGVRLYFDGSEETTAISSIENGQLTIDNVYNLQGQQLAAPQKGINIIGGKKVLVK